MLITAVAGIPQWPQFRGPNCSGVAEGANPPIRFGPDTNLVWKLVVPPGLSSPAHSELIALDTATGNTIWRVSCPLAKDSYSTPMVWRHNETEKLLVQSLGRLTAYTLDQGKVKWWVKGWNFDAVMTAPVAGDGLLFAGGSGINDPSETPDPIFDWKKSLARFDANHDGQIAISELPSEEVWHMRKEVPNGAPGSVILLTELFGFMDANNDKIITKAEWDVADAESRDPLAIDHLVAIRPGGKDDATETHVVWKTSRGLPEIPSPLYYRGSLYLVRDGGMWTAIDAPSGKILVDRERLGILGQFVASPVAANGYIYAASESGTIAVIRAGNNREVAALNKLGESVRTTPAIAGRALYVRTEKHLMAFAAQSEPPR